MGIRFVGDRGLIKHIVLSKGFGEIVKVVDELDLPFNESVVVAAQREKDVLRFGHLDTRDG
jgi:hypothetical protein